MREISMMWRHVPVAAMVLLAAGCGGGGQGNVTGVGSNNGGGSTIWQSGIYQPSSNFEARCASPRSGVDPFTKERYPDVTGTMTDQNNWLRSWTNELYLWYSEVPDLNPALYTTDAYFERLKTSALTASGAAKDKFHFTYATTDWEALSQGGVEVSYGLQWALLASTPPRRAVIAYVEPSPPSATVAAGVARGAEVLEVDGVDVVNTSSSAGVDTLNAGLFPDTANETHTFTIKDVGSTTPRTITLTSANFSTVPVQNVRTLPTGTGPVGYILFNDHIATAEGALVTAITTLRDASVTDLVLDIRYNGGGFLDIANELAYMIAGPTATAGQTFEQLKFNDKHPTTDPVTGEALLPTQFHNTTQGFTQGLAKGQALPTLSLPRVFVLTGSNTCSASESIINSLRGVNVEVIQIGSTTCGKPYGFYPFDNCGTTYFSIQFRGVNAKGFGDYTDGFSPINTVGGAGEPQSRPPGCSVADDFTHDLGDVAEGRLSAALSYRDLGSCAGPPTGTVKAMSVESQQRFLQDAVVPKSPWRENRILRQ
ncbi:MAG: S41 family peptidase [Gammaproteobacteria bacterium]